MIIPKNLEELASYVESDQKVVFFFTADWCPDCQFIYPVMPEIEALHPDMTFVRVNRDDYMALAQTWNIFGIPSFVVTQNWDAWSIKLVKPKKKSMPFWQQYKENP